MNLIGQYEEIGELREKGGTRTRTEIRGNQNKGELDQTRLRTDIDITHIGPGRTRGGYQGILVDTLGIGQREDEIRSITTRLVGDQRGYNLDGEQVGLFPSPIQEKNPTQQRPLYNSGQWIPKIRDRELPGFRKRVKGGVTLTRRGK